MTPHVVMSFRSILVGLFQVASDPVIKVSFPDYQVKLFISHRIRDYYRTAERFSILIVGS